MSVQLQMLTRWGLALTLPLLLVGCQNAPSTLRGAGRAATEINQLWWFMLVAGSIIYIGVMGLLVMAYRRRAHTEPTTDPIDPDQMLDESTALATGANKQGTRMIVLGGIVMPIVVLTAVYAFTVETLLAISSQRTADLPTIEVIGHQWWWEVQYPEQGVVTANEIYIPAGEPVQFILTSVDVNHSFWVPELHGKLDMIPGRVNRFWIDATEPGVYRGICAEFCGIQHANMYFLVVALPPAEYATWLSTQQQPLAPPPDQMAEIGQQIFLDSGCGACHAIAGTAAAGDLGPDLTNLAERRTLAAGVIENNEANLREWLLHPQQTKPGSLMPATILPDDQFDALVAYLQTLRHE